MRRLLSTFVFGGAFIWVAVVFFDVPREIIWVFLGFDCGLGFQFGGCRFVRRRLLAIDAPRAAE